LIYQNMREYNEPSTDFSIWRSKWEEQAIFQGEKISNAEIRIKAISSLWSENVPGDDWKRNFQKGEFTIRKKLGFGNSPQAYCRSDKNNPNPGEHQIERDIIQKWDEIKFFDKYRLEPIVNAFPCAKDSSGGRTANVEFDLLGVLKKNASVVHPLICEIKTGAGGSKTPWYAAIENLRQLKLFIGNRNDNLEFIKAKRPEFYSMKFAAPVGIVIAEEAYYTAAGQKCNSVAPTQELLRHLQISQTSKEARVILATWDKMTNRIDRYGGCEIDDVFCT